MAGPALPFMHDGASLLWRAQVSSSTPQVVARTMLQPLQVASAQPTPVFSLGLSSEI